ncbi:hypothetical protein Q4E93_29425 [Flavitalea sp. BT771]|uniref:hypothetical protein n=1 Tax=Flavitalea sp. BT771 TaxID=3063329 RepID=UPI0026E32F87|nr:hypothetical protein [Flavitalea sp. BT771]MDO6434769.1 hypothetical protein [Flavitalea sp. BT771]MDV6223669.1 hypothetical protein [Flavitalea sp. BT771]
MKTIIIAALLLIFSICRSATCQAQMNPCAHFLSPVLSLSAGGPYNLFAEGGVMGFSERIGVYAGAKLFLREQPSPAKTSSQFSETIKPYARLSYRISNQDASLIRQYLTGWYGANGIRGVSYRLGVILSESTMLALEPNYSRENGKGVNITLTARLD